MNKFKLFIKLFFLLFISFVNVEASSPLDDETAKLTRSNLHAALTPHLPSDIWLTVFEIGRNDKILLKTLRSVCIALRNKEAKIAGETRKFYFRLCRDSLSEFKTSSFPNVIIQAETLGLDPLFIEKSYASCKKITSLEVSSPGFEAWPYFNCVTLVSLKNLKKLDIQRRTFFPADFYPIMQLLNLEELNVAGGNFVMEAFSFIQKLTNLKYLNVYCCYLSNKQGKSLFRLTQLEKLDMDSNFLETDGLREFDNFTKLTNLKVLCLDDDMARTYRNFILTLSSLSSLRIGGNFLDLNNFRDEKLIFRTDKCLIER